jgi:hypothetical protein
MEVRPLLILKGFFTRSLEWPKTTVFGQSGLPKAFLEKWRKNQRW